MFELEKRAGRAGILGVTVMSLQCSLSSVTDKKLDKRSQMGALEQYLRLGLRHDVAF